MDSGSKIIRLIFPPRCVFCRQVIDISTPGDICGQCYLQIPFHKGEALLFPGDGFDALFSLFRYEGIVRRSLINYKFFGREACFRTYAGLLYERLLAANILEGIDLVLSVPLHPARLRKRGYNQARLLSAALARKMGKPEVSRLLERVINTQSQSRLPGASRSSNVRGAFRCKEAPCLQGKTVMLVDDILTTGSTMGECARTLKAAGAGKVVAVVIATLRGERLYSGV